ncbi:MAG: sigma-54 dependent transcriptional regulator [Gammaproteobacteria bacterium]|nr:sigma-54 dependent transcriptional regulator [Gammaproteobacteria bacterium]MDH3448875.1 sigma-54 dependent transcriptional regulator [Gammaproteobacteria bacterium]
MVDVLVVEDDDALREAICDTLELNQISFHEVENGRAAERFLANNSASLVLSDVQMSPGNGYELLSAIRRNQIDVPVILMTAYGSIPQAVDAIQAGAADYLVKPFEVSSLVSTVRKQIQNPVPVDQGLLAVDSLSQETLLLAKRVAQTDASVLLKGESGVGKEVYSRFIHQHSARSGQAFVAINCAAIPENMLEAVLFGYEKGAFTGAHKATMGKFEQAQGGTLLLDEITEMDLGLQAKILRVLQEKEVERLGSSKIIELDVRIIATTNRDLRQEVRDKRFREDLFYRLNVFPITIPSLRARPDDIVPIARMILAQYSRAAGQSIQLSAEAGELLCQHSWPGNVRELDNVIQRALIMKQGNEIQSQDIMLESAIEQAALEPLLEDDGLLHSDLRDRETEVILETLRQFRGSRKKTAEKLGISPRTLRYKLARLREAGAPVPE